MLGSLPSLTGSPPFPLGSSALSTDGSLLTAPPDAFGSFRVLHQIGVGSLGPVFRAHDPTQDRPVAVKVFRGDYTPEQVRQLADALGQLVDAHLDHPVIVQPIAAGVEGHLPYLVQAFVVAESMDVALREYGPAPLADALTRITHLAAALDLAATLGVRHGALHPRDVLVAAGTTKLSGLGIAEAIERIGGRVTMRRPYAAPERERPGAWGGPADTFAFAVIAFELMYGRRVSGLGAAAMAGVPPLAGVDHEAVQELMASALAADPDARPSSALAFAASLQEAVLDPHATPTLASPVRRRARRKPIALPVEVAPPLPLDAATDPTADVPPFLQPETPSSRDRFEGARLDAPLGGLDQAFDRLMDGELAAARVDPAAFDASTDFHLDLRLDPSERRHMEEHAGESSSEPNDGPRAEAVAPPDADASLATEDRAANAPPPREAGHARDALAEAERDVDATAAAPTDEPFATFRGAPPAARSPWPMAMAMLLVGLLVGFGAGYQMGTRAPGAGVRGAEVLGARGAEVLGARGAEVQGARGAEVPGASNAPAPAPPAPRAADVVEVSGAVLVRSDPPGARVMVNGQPRGVTPLAVRDIPFGAHTIAVTLAGYGPRQQRVALTRTRPSRSLDFTLRRIPEEYFGALQIDSRPTGARVFVDGKEAGITPFAAPRVAIGSHVIRIEMDGYQPWSTSVQVVAGDRARVAASLDR